MTQAMEPGNWVEDVYGKLRNMPLDYVAPPSGNHKDQKPTGSYQPTTPKPIEYRRITSAELNAADYRIDYLIDDVLVAGQPGLISGRKKTIKTGIAIDQAVSLATATPHLDRFEVPLAVNVGIMSGEAGLPTLQETGRRIALAHNIPLGDIDGLLWSDQLPTLGDPKHGDALKRFVEENELQVLYIDPAYLAMPAAYDAGNLFAAGQVLRTLTTLTEETGVTAILIHHNRKNPSRAFAMPELDEIAWAGFGEWARQWVLLERRCEFDPESDGRHELWASIGGSAGHHSAWAVDITEGRRSDEFGRRWEVSVRYASSAVHESSERDAAAKQSAKEIQDDATRRRRVADVLKALKAYPEGETRTVLKETAGLNGNAFGPVILLLQEEGVVEPCLVAKNGTEYPGFRPTKTGTQTQPDSPGLSGSDTHTHPPTP